MFDCEGSRFSGTVKQIMGIMRSVVAIRTQIENCFCSGPIGGSSQYGTGTSWQRLFPAANLWRFSVEDSVFGSCLLCS